MRSKVRSAVSKKFLATCWVIVEAPCTRFDALQEHEAGAQDALGIEAAMGIEILVLGGDEGVLDQRRNGRRRQIKTTLARIFGQKAAVGGVNARHHRRLVILQLGIVGQILLELPDHGGDDGRRDDEDDRARREHETEETGDAAHVSIQDLLGPDDDPSRIGSERFSRAPYRKARALVRKLRPLTDARRVHVGRDCGETMKPTRASSLSKPAARLAASIFTASARRRLAGRRGISRARRLGRGRFVRRGDGVPRFGRPLPVASRGSEEPIDRVRHRARGLGAPIRRVHRLDVLRVGEIAEFDEHGGKSGALSTTKPAERSGL